MMPCAYLARVQPEASDEKSSSKSIVAEGAEVEAGDPVVDKPQPKTVKAKPISKTHERMRVILSWRPHPYPNPFPKLALSLPSRTGVPPVFAARTVSKGWE